MKTNLRFAILTLAAVTPAALDAQASGLNGAVGVWGVQTNTPQWNHDLGVAYTRQGCPDAPASCLSFTGRVAAANNVKVSLAIPLNSGTPAAAQEYSRLSAGASFLEEVTIDDFVAQYKALFTGALVPPSSVVASTIWALKSHNPNLKFGATIYEDELTGAYLQDARLPLSVRKGFDVVHLFLHYREDGLSFTNYVAEAKRVFPNAVVVAGSYAVDRRAFLPCTPGGSPCTTEQDYDFFAQTFVLQVQLMRNRSVAAIEFFPGYFGMEDQWPGLSNPRECPPGEIAECVVNTKRMRQFALNALHNQTGQPVWTFPLAKGPLPAARYFHSAAIDSASDRMIVFGGTLESGVMVNDTWILANADGLRGQPAWVSAAAVNAPPAAYYSVGMYDPASNRMMVYGGATGTDVWVLTNANGLKNTAPAWIQLRPTGNPPPSLTNFERHVYDAASNRMIVYDSTAGVWVLTNANGEGGAPDWIQLNALAGPAGRGGFSAVYNSASNRMIVFGGSDGSTAFYDIWVLTNANGSGGAPRWVPLPTATTNAPAGRESHYAVYDPTNDAMTIFGGIGADSATWTAFSASGLTQPPVWTMVNGGSGLEPPTFGTAVMNTNNLSMIVFGGMTTQQVLNTAMDLSPLM